jgi:hypothetical protein
VDDQELPRWLAVLFVATSIGTFCIGSYLEIFHSALLVDYPYWASLLSMVTGFTTSASLITIFVRRIQLRRARDKRRLAMQPAARVLAAEAAKVLAGVMVACGSDSEELWWMAAEESVWAWEAHGACGAQGSAAVVRRFFEPVFLLSEAAERLVAPLEELVALLSARRIDADEVWLAVPAALRIQDLVARVNAELAASYGGHASPWTVRHVQRAAVDEQVAGLAERVRELRAEEPQASRLRDAVSACRRFSGEWAAQPEFDEVVKRMRNLLFVSVRASGIIRDLPSLIDDLGDLADSCPVPAALAAELVHLWAALLDTTRGTGVAVLIERSFG